MSGLSRAIKRFGGRKGGASRGGTPGSHVNTKANKRIANKAARHTNDYLDLLTEEEVTAFYLDEEPH